MRRALLPIVVTASGIAHAQDNRFPLPPKEWPAPVADQAPFVFLLLDRLEYRIQKGADAQFWDAQGWYGGDYNKLWLKSEGQRVDGRIADADQQVLFARRIAPFWHLQGGLRVNCGRAQRKTTACLRSRASRPT